jgi:hypothetical protein
MTEPAIARGAAPRMSASNQSPSLLQRKSDEVEAARVGVGGRTAANVTKAELPELGVATTGVVFVHGIGEQVRAEILLGWARPIVQAVADWSRSIPDAERIDGPIPSADRVVRSGIDFEGSDLPLVTVGVPGRNVGGVRHEPQTWVMTEARWAQDVRPPSLETMIDWCGPRGVVATVVGRIVDASLAGEGPAAMSGGRLTGIVTIIRRIGSAFSGLRPVVRTLSQMGLSAFVSIVVTFGLLAYAFVRAIAGFIPNQQIQDAVARFGLDTFLTTWWGDVYVLLDDPVQAANIRGQVAKAVRALRHFGCTRIVLVAHSGGTIVSLMALSDRALTERVDTLITHGQAVQMGRMIWEQEGADPTNSGARIQAGTPIRTDRWRDFHGTHDPAPAGRLAEATSPGIRPPGLVFEDDETWNRMSIADDHGEYFSNDEEFVEVVLTEVETAGGSATASRFETGRDARRLLHRQRVFVLALWKRLMFVIPTMAIFAAFFTPSQGLIGGLGDAARTIALAIPVVPDVFRWIHSVVPGGYAGLVTASATVFAIVYGLAIIQAAMPIGRLGVWDTAWRWIVFGALDTGVFLVGVAVAIAVRAAEQKSAGAGVQGFVDRFTDTPLKAAIAFLIGMFLVLLLDSLRRRSGPAATTEVRTRPYPLAVRLAVIVIAFAIIGTAAYGVIVDRQIRGFVGAAVLAFALYQLLGRIGIWRWGRWDDAERSLARRRSGDRYPRWWVWVEFLPLGAVATIAALGIALGNADLLSRAGYLLAVLIVAYIVIDVAVRPVAPGSQSADT